MNSRVEKAKEWIDEISSHNSQDLDKILFFMNLMLTKRDLYYENVRLEKEIERLKQNIDYAIKLLEPIVAFGMDIAVKGKMLEPILDKLKEVNGSDKE